jgi:hypothetical protein
LAYRQILNWIGTVKAHNRLASHNESTSGDIPVQ